MKNNQTRNLTLGAMFIALGLLMPFITAQIPSISSQLCPMHFPVILCGFVLGGQMGLLVGFITPLLRSLIFGMPPIMTAICMAFELATYGFVSGFLFEKWQKKTSMIYPSLLLAMVAGRVVWGVVSLLIYALSGSAFTATMFISGALLNAVPGIILQLIIIPALVLALKKAKWIK